MSLIKRFEKLLSDMEKELEKIEKERTATYGIQACEVLINADKQIAELRNQSKFAAAIQLRSEAWDTYEKLEKMSEKRQNNIEKYIDKSIELKRDISELQDILFGMNQRG